MSLTHDDVRKILEMLDQSDFDDVHIEFGDLKIDMRRHGSASELQSTTREPKIARAPAAPPPHARSAEPLASPATSTAAAALPAGVIAATAPMVGTFYRAPAPGARPFVEVGDRVGADDTLCLLEVMKLFTSLKAGIAGTIEAILVENASLVEAGQPLILIRRESA